jgi:predicted ATPase
MFLGEFVAAHEHLEHGIALYDPVRHRSHAYLYGQEPGVFCRVMGAWDLCLLGYSDQALIRSQEALVVAQEVAHPLSLTAAQTVFAFTHQFRREGHAAQEHAETAVGLCSQHGFPFFLGLATIMLGWARAEQGHTEEGIAQMRQGIADYQATGAELPKPRIIALLAEALGKVGQPEEGLNVLAEALAVVNKNGERDYEAELYRLKGELILQQFKVQGSTFQATDPRLLTPDSQGEAEACFLKAIEIAQKQQAKSWELRASTSLARLWQQQGKATEAHKLLSDVYNWFTEGFDTKDLQEAKALLEELRH